jgi:predicted site-specific integrase-resolvase
MQEQVFLTKAQLARRYAVSVRTVNYWMEKGAIPFIRISRKVVRFDPEKCDGALARFEVQARTAGARARVFIRTPPDSQTVEDS